MWMLWLLLLLLLSRVYCLIWIATKRLLAHVGQRRGSRRRLMSSNRRICDNTWRIGRHVCVWWHELRWSRWLLSIELIHLINLLLLLLLNQIGLFILLLLLWRHSLILCWVAPRIGGRQWTVDISRGIGSRIGGRLIELTQIGLLHTLGNVKVVLHVDLHVLNGGGGRWRRRDLLATCCCRWRRLGRYSAASRCRWRLWWRRWSHRRMHVAWGIHRGHAAIYILILERILLLRLRLHHHVWDGLVGVVLLLLLRHVLLRLVLGSRIHVRLWLLLLLMHVLAGLHLGVHLLRLLWMARVLRGGRGRAIRVYALLLLLKRVYFIQ